MRNILITGGAGFIGANFARYLADQKPEANLTIMDALTYAGSKKNLDPLLGKSNFRFIHGNICDQPLVAKVFLEQKIDTVVHFAAETHVDRSIAAPDIFIETNVVGTHVLLKTALDSWRREGFQGKRFHHVSTDEVYGSLAPDAPAFTELSPYSPNSPYAASKAGSDFLARAYHQTYGLPVSISNCSNNYGPCQFPEKLLPLCLLNILAGRPLPIYGDGRQVRDWLFVDDHSRGIALILAQGRLGETYNIGGDDERVNIETVRLLCRLVDQLFAEDEALRRLFPRSPPSGGKESQSLIAMVADRAGHDARYAIDAGKITRELGFKPLVDFETGLTRMIKWYLANYPK